MSDPTLGAVLWLAIGLSAAALHLVSWSTDVLDAAWGPWRADHLIAPP